jgi:hypothetical protein
MDVLTIPDPDLAAIYGAPLALIRPDQIVAWRGQTWQDGALHRASGWG